MQMAEPKPCDAGRKGRDKVDLMATLDEKPPEKVVKLVEEIVKLNMIETRELIKMLKKELNIPDMPMGMPMGMQMMGGGGAPAAAPAGVAAEAAAPVVEKTEFELKLESFNAPDKLKVIKEVRAITGLGLKESKELVEKSPSIIKAGLTKEDAEKLKKVLEDNGGKVEIVNFSPWPYAAHVSAMTTAATAQSRTLAHEEALNSGQLEGAENARDCNNFDVTGSVVVVRCSVDGVPGCIRQGLENGTGLAEKGVNPWI
eukprot:CAMPEP_0179477210 /NCGR_PEP_ID=MMETSP0799-20121207/56014_1 /TAXON_ID=46947 /ORGANISM="Geminigera cryophila, Strain CCMP2564" /LENGTH=256 /DNA_ID=CAMNT_0021287741 /DNA_START=260 /DNA_END=1030 /DNA_ORIENTATION=-